MREGWRKPLSTKMKASEEVSPLVKACQHLLQPNGCINGNHVSQAVLPCFPNLLSAFPVQLTSKSALACVDGRKALDHARIRDFILQTGEVLHRMQIGRGHRVAVVLPNGPELALAILAVSTWACCVPLNAFGAANELETDLECAAIDLVIGLLDEENKGIAELAQRVGVSFCGLQSDTHEAGLFQLIPPTTNMPSATPRKYSIRPNEADRSAGSQTTADQRFLPNAHSDEVLVLFTSGTTGSKKLVPHLLADVLVATACITLSWNLTPSDTNCNLMPLFHVGGIIRQVFSPILSGGCVICCPSFDPNIFWSLMGQQKFTWYYAAPTMHHLILQTGKAEGYIGNQGPNPKLRMIANAAGGLLPSLARELRQAFGANVLPSYGMTECMPITSPPASYQLEKPGTSGVAVGPEVAILNLETMKALECGKEGPICVRGEPCFRGYGVLYGQAGQEKVNSFLPGNWFDTGDLGYMDEDGYLYITGRSKEVINRGGEIISPLEVEEAVNGHPDVLQAVAFSTQHSILQEVVGLVMVTKPRRPRLDLPALHEYLGDGRLAASKWPQCLVYMDGVPKSHTNKLLRVKLGQRLSIPEVNDSMNWIERTFQAKCPKIGTPVSVAIPCERVKVNPAFVQAILRESLVKNYDQDLVVVPHPTRLGGLVAHVYNINRMALIQVAKERLDAYSVPSHVCQLSATYSGEQDLTPPQPSDAIGSILMEAQSSGQGPADPLVMGLQELFQDLLDLDCLPAPDTNFFNLGGSSMLASQLASKIRKLHDVPFGGAEVFHHSSCNSMADLIRQRQQGDSEGGNGSVSEKNPASAASSLFTKNLDLSGLRFEPTRLDGTSGCLATVFQLVPLFVVYPIWQLTRFFLFFRMLLAVLHKVPGGNNIVAFVITLVIFHFLWVTITPLLFVVIKWTVIGSYRKGRYPVWSEYYLRWWFVDVLRKLIGRGIWGSNDASLNFYYRLLGAKIGRYARISSEAEIAEFDLVEIGEGAAVEYATLRGFGVDNGAIILGPVSVGKFGSVGAKSVVAPYTCIPEGAHLGTVTSSYEINVLTAEPGDDLKHVRYNRKALPEPSMLFQMLICNPITLIVDTLSHIPALLVLYWMVKMPWHHNEPFETIGNLLEWLCDIRRIPFYIGIHLARTCVAPLIYMAAAIIVKWCVIGKFEPGPRDTFSEWQLARHRLAATLFSRENMQECIELLGRHYELISILYRLLGAKVGKRVFWPGHQPIFSGEFDLLEIGDDVVFGSRAAIFCTTADSCEKVILCAGANVSDNTVVLPGSIIGKNTVLGSNSVCPAGRYLPESSVWFGARCGEPVMLEKGVEDFYGATASSEVDSAKLQMEGDDSTLRPFGKAFYHREAPYFVLPLSFMIFFTFVSKLITSTVHTLPILGALHLSAGYFYGFDYYARDYSEIEVSSTDIYAATLFFFFLTHIVRVFLWIFIELAAKWGFMGQRREGRFNWDQCNYAQNWEMYQILTMVRSYGRCNFFDFLAGTPLLATFFRLNGSKIGKDCCLFPAGADPFMPEPDLLEMGDRCLIDCASLVCHLNTRGNFELAKIKLENNVTLRTRSRLQQGVYMESGSMLLEKSLAMTGEVIEAESVWQGAPAARLFSYDNSSIGTHSSMDYGNGGNNNVHTGTFV